MLTLRQIIDEVDNLVPNPFDDATKVAWLNQINKDFFEIVKIPLVVQFPTTSGTSPYVIPREAKSRNIARVQVGDTLYASMQYEEVNPGNNYWIVNDDEDDTFQYIHLEPKPYATGKVCVVIYHMTTRRTFTTVFISVDKPEAPEEHHWTYVLGLCERVAKAMNDVTLANNYGNDYRAQLLIAQQNYARQ